MRKALKKAAAFENTRDNEYTQGVAIDEYTEGLTIMDEEETEQYFKAQALENAQAKAQGPFKGDILSAKLCKNSNIMLFVKLPDGEKVNIFVSVAELQGMSINLAIVPTKTTTPNGIEITDGYQIVNTPEELQALFKHKNCAVSKLEKYIITEIW